jgi:NAD(P)H-hydrate repair Nnr-like enzyme with NAD(P)H-hydrate epimerase domain
VVVLAGNNNYAGSYGLAAARHLLNRGCQVIVCIAAGANANISQRIASQEYVIQLAGGRIVRRVEGKKKKMLLCFKPWYSSFN